MFGTAGTVAVALVSGCTGTGLGITDETSDRPTKDTEGTFEARLSGSETDQLLFDRSDISSVGELREQSGSFVLRVTLSADATESVSETFRTAGVSDDTDAFEIVLVSTDEEIDRVGITPGLAEKIASGEWDGEFVLTFSDREQAEAIRETLA